MKELLTEFLSNILKEEDDPYLTYTDEKNKQRKAKASTLSTYDKKHPGRKAYDIWASSRKKSKVTPLDAPQSATAKVPNKQPTAAANGTRKRAEVPQSDEVPMSKADGSIPPKPLTRGSAARDEEILKVTEESMRQRGFSDQDDQTRFETFTKLWRAFLGAPSYEEQVKAVRAMADQKMIEAGASGKKIYMTSNTGLPPKHLCGQAGTAVTKLMNQIISSEGIDVGMRGNAADRALADMSGKHNEAGVTAYLFPSEENKQAYKLTEDRYKQLGGDSVVADDRNKSAAEAVRATLPKGAKITNAIQVGGVGATQLKQLGIDPKTDPTDILVEYSVNGKIQTMKISAKIYTDPRNITMKNSGVTKAGVDYLGEPEGSLVDKEWPAIMKKYKWTPDMTDEQKVELKSKLKQTYLKKFAGEMEKLSSTPKGQARLLKMWQSVHGCGKDVHTLVINKSTNECTLKPPSHYCDPKIPFKVKYDGVKVVIEMSTGGPQTLQIDLKTEDKGSPKLLFRHIVRDKK